MMQIAMISFIFLVHKYSFKLQTVESRLSSALWKDTSLQTFVIGRDGS